MRREGFNKSKLRIPDFPGFFHLRTEGIWGMFSPEFGVGVPRDFWECLGVGMGGMERRESIPVSGGDGAGNEGIAGNEHKGRGKRGF